MTHFSASKPTPDDALEEARTEDFIRFLAEHRHTITRTNLMTTYTHLMTIAGCAADHMMTQASQTAMATYINY